MQFKEIVNRLTGISCPIFGISWNPSETDRAIAQRAVTFLEDRRVLYSPSEIELPDHCVQSVLRIREFLTNELTRLHSRDSMAESFRAMRSACRKFLNAVQAEDDNRIVHFANSPGHYASWEFNQALGELRGIFGVQVARLAAQYGLDVENDLAKILPESDRE
jgi:hypothetical protein